MPVCNEADRVLHLDRMPPPLVHGKRYTYTKRKCRCDKCKEANAQYKSYKTANYRALQASQASESLSTDAQDFLASLTHGLPSTYEWYGCRCRECKEAEARVMNSRNVTKVLLA